MRILFILIFLTMMLTSCKNINSECNNIKINQIIDGKKEGLFIYYDSLGNIESIFNYKNNKSIGDGIGLNRNFKVESKISIDTNGKMNGETFWFHKDSSFSIIKYVENNKNGISKSYYKTGELEFIAEYLEGGNLVRRITFDKNGKVIKEEYANDWKPLKSQLGKYIHEIKI